MGKEIVRREGLLDHEEPEAIQGHELRNLVGPEARIDVHHQGKLGEPFPDHIHYPQTFSRTDLDLDPVVTLLHRQLNAIQKLLHRTRYPQADPRRDAGRFSPPETGIGAPPFPWPTGPIGPFPRPPWPWGGP